MIHPKAQQPLTSLYRAGIQKGPESARANPLRETHYRRHSLVLPILSRTRNLTSLVVMSRGIVYYAVMKKAHGGLKIV